MSPGVSTRKVARVTEQLCGFEVSSTEGSRCVEALDDELRAWRERPLGDYPYVVLDARYEKMRHGSQWWTVPVLLAMGVDVEGKRELLGVSVALSEAEVHWRTRHWAFSTGEQAFLQGADFTWREELR